MKRMLSVVAIVLASCGSVAVDYCDKRCACEGCGELDVEACITRAENDLSRADLFDCGDQADELLTCREAQGVCEGARFDTGACNAKRDALEECEHAKSAEHVRIMN